MSRPHPDSVIALAPALARRQARAAVGHAREQVERASCPEAPGAPSSNDNRIALGFEQEEAWLGGGLAAAGLHEAWAASPADAPAALAFALLLAELKRRQAPAHSPPLLWLREETSRTRDRPHAPGLAMLGIDPGAITLLALPDPRAVLRAGLDATVAPSAAHSRWQVAAAASAPPIGAASAPGRPAFALTLLRQRGGRDGLHLYLEWNRDTACFHERGWPLEAGNPAVQPPAVQPTAVQASGGQPALFGARLAMATGAAGAARRAGAG